MKKKLLFPLLCLGFFLIFFMHYYRKPSCSTISISAISDLENYMQEHGIENPTNNDIHFYNINESTILVIDNRNNDFSQYTHTEITAKIQNNQLTIIAKDSNATSEGDISGTYGVIISYNAEITNVSIRKED